MGRSNNSYNNTNNSAAAAAPAVVVAAATGIAATHINGMTIHSWAGVRLGVGGSKTLVPRVLQNTAACNRWRKAKVLVLDEVSMRRNKLTGSSRMRKFSTNIAEAVRHARTN